MATALQITSGPQTGSCYLVEQTTAEGSGSVARALVETMSRELGVLYGFLQQVYDSAFVSTDDGALTGTLTIVEVTAAPAVLAQADVSVRDTGIGRLTVESRLLPAEEHHLPVLETCSRARLHGPFWRD